MIDLLFWDSLQAWGPGVARPSGGWEVMCRQLTQGIASMGYEVHAYRPAPAGYLGGVHHWDVREAVLPLTCRCLVLGRNTAIPRGVNAERVLVAAVDDPRHQYHPEYFSWPVVCLSEWQAGLFRDRGHKTHVIPSMIDDWIYDLKPVKRAGSYCCVNAWNKGTDATLRLWQELKLPGELTVGSPYGAPPDAAVRCMRAGARWVGQLGPAQVVAVLASSEAVFRVCERPETFGVTDAIAEVLGCRVHALFTNGYGASKDVISMSFATDSPQEFRKMCEWGPSFKHEGKTADYRASTLLPRWREVMGLT